MKSAIFLTIINPPLVFGVTGGFAMLILFLLFVSAIVVKASFGVVGMLISMALTLRFYFHGVKKTAQDPYWLNTLILAFLFEKKKPLRFLSRIFSKKDQTLYR